MTESPTRTKMIRAIAVTYVVAILILTIRAGEPGRLEWWLGGSLLIGLMASPIVAGLWVSNKIVGGMAGSLFVAAVACIAVVGFGLQWYTMFMGPSDAQNALVLIVVPILQWLAVGAAFAVAWFLGRYVGKP